MDQIISRVLIEMRESSEVRFDTSAVIEVSRRRISDTNYEAQ